MNIVRSSKANSKGKPYFLVLCFNIVNFLKYLIILRINEKMLGFFLLFSSVNRLTLRATGTRNAI